LIRGLYGKRLMGGVPLGYTLGIVFTELLVIKSGVPLGKKSYSDEEIEREILVLVVAERAHAMGIFC